MTERLGPLAKLGATITDNPGRVGLFFNFKKGLGGRVLDAVSSHTWSSYQLERGLVRARAGVNNSKREAQKALIRAVQAAQARRKELSDAKRAQLDTINGSINRPLQNSELQLRFRSNKALEKDLQQS